MMSPGASSYCSDSLEMISETDQVILGVGGFWRRRPRPVRAAGVGEAAGGELILLRQLGDDLRDGPGHLGGRRVLAHGAVDLEGDRARPVAHVAGRVDRPARGRVVEGLSHLPGPALVLGDGL